MGCNPIEWVAHCTVQVFGPLCALSDDDSDLEACVRNIERALSVRWGERYNSQGPVLRRSIHPIGFWLLPGFYCCYDGEQLLHGSDAWAVGDRMSELLNAFHRRCDRLITRIFIRKDARTAPSRTTSLEEAKRNGSPSKYVHMRERRAGLMERCTKKTAKHTGTAPNLPWQREISQHTCWKQHFQPKTTRNGPSETMNPNDKTNIRSSADM